MIDAIVETVYINEDGSGKLKLKNVSDERLRGQAYLHFDSAPEEVTALNGLEIQGDGHRIYIAETVIAERLDDVKVRFVGMFTTAIGRYPELRRQRERNL